MAVIIALSAITEGIANSGKLTRVQLYSKALEGNLLGDSPKREVIVYLPPSYKTNKSKRYPVVYLLHGNSASDTKPDSNPAVRWVVDINKPSGRYNQRGIKSIMDSSIENGGVKEMIVVMPNGRNKYRGSHYVNSPVSEIGQIISRGIWFRSSTENTERSKAGTVGHWPDIRWAGEGR